MKESKPADGRWTHAPTQTIHGLPGKDDGTDLNVKQLQVQRSTLPADIENGDGHQNGFILCQYFHGRTGETPTPEHSEQTMHLVEVHR